MLAPFINAPEELIHVIGNAVSEQRSWILDKEKDGVGKLRI